ncbi:lipoyltransferase 1, mitochondrial [Leptopilina heterotoma]|uniref:lipoyltransferase 1, mitochondrial n=1 Tax=Leptopilina heterotoma TaxID=63436 RepID=UPI001CA89092|nr:lipoyltransferase 1, mitochondrial [Leptopilina heterotoma]
MSVIHQRNIARVFLRNLIQNTRYISTDVPEDEIQKSVFISQSTDIHRNLALEDWFYRNYNFRNHHLLLLWKSDPCVVIGRHQNPWIEANISSLENNGIALARRNSGGGTVYHDSGNLNLSFFTPKERYNRRYNLDIITRGIFREWGLKTTVNKKDDIVVQNEFKISGTAAKLGRPNAYHHCTLLVDANKRTLSLALERKETGITTNATQSIRSLVKNLTEINPHVRIDKLMNAIGWEFLRTKPLIAEDGGYNLVQKQRGFQMINPTEGWFPGIEELTGEFRSWQWIYGKTPKFTVTRHIEMKTPNTSSHHRLKLILDVQDGIVNDIQLILPTDLVPIGCNENASVITNLRGSRYSPDIIDNIISAIGGKVVHTDSSQNTDEEDAVAT